MKLKITDQTPIALIISALNERKASIMSQNFSGQERFEKRLLPSLDSVISKMQPGEVSLKRKERIHISGALNHYIHCNTMLSDVEREELHSFREKIRIKSLG